jgi:hypothetical protein
MEDDEAQTAQYNEDHHNGEYPFVVSITGKAGFKGRDARVAKRHNRVENTLIKPVLRSAALKEQRQDKGADSFYGKGEKNYVPDYTLGVVLKPAYIVALYGITVGEREPVSRDGQNDGINADYAQSPNLNEKYDDYLPETAEPGGAYRIKAGNANRRGGGKKGVQEAKPGFTVCKALRVALPGGGDKKQARTCRNDDKKKGQQVKRV